jgi:hypothetical protein
MKRQSLAFGLTWLAVMVAGVQSIAQETTTIETGADGVTYRVTHRVTQRSIPTTEYQTRQSKSYRPQVTTEYKSYPQTYIAPVTEYQWVARYRGWWNPFVQPYWSHELVPVTRWEARPGTVQLPVARTDWVEETHTTQVPVTTYRTVQDQSTSRVAISAPPSSTAVASGNSSTRTSVALRPIGGQQMQSDPPRAGNPWNNGASGTYRR